MLERTRKANALASLLYGLLITWILLFYCIDLTAYLSVEVVATYDSRTFSSMEYVLVENEWCRKESGHAKVEPPKMGLAKEENKRFWEVFDEVVRGMPSFEKIFIRGDFNGHIGSLARGYDNVYGGFSFRDRNEESAAFLDFTRAFGLVVVNLNFLKKEEHLITFLSAVSKT
ncbi:uncharacterized protein LOC124899532 [Capsicum annuum]|uniref:uncharacterized protein LOC124899532 n=1 Tax=Capsicum annuum TaxID=4072 RepID=UPI001FB14260|nr:uncharacterized protein LOC124899532 [Capsicum annuum]